MIHMRSVLSLILALLVSQAHAEWKSDADFRFQNGDQVGIGVYRVGKKAEILMKKIVSLDGSGRAKLENGKEVKIGFGNIKSAMASVEEGYRTDNDLIGLDVEAVIYAHRGRNIISILGEVATPGHGPWKEGITLEEAVKLAGGFKKGAYLKRIAIQRGTESLILDCRPPNVAKEFKLEAGDAIAVDLAPMNL